jgi:hypothetical protein
MPESFSQKQSNRGDDGLPNGRIKQMTVNKQCEIGSLKSKLT